MPPSPRTRGSRKTNAGPRPAFSFSYPAFRQTPIVHTPSRAIPTPCIGVCALDARGLCSGCGRTMAEIARWSQMGDDERLHLMDVVLPTRMPPDAQ